MSEKFSKETILIEKCLDRVITEVKLTVDVLIDINKNGVTKLSREEKKYLIDKLDEIDIAFSKLDSI